MLPTEHMSETIAAVATGRSAGAVSMVRLCGPDALRITQELLRKGGKRATLPLRQATLVSVMDGEKLLDRAVAVYFKAPASFTGDDIVEIACHGSAYITARLLELACAAGARAAMPGEFSMRAFLNGKMDLAQAEGLCDLITATSAAAHRAAISLTEGRVSAVLLGIKSKTLDVLAEIEARLDDSDEEMPPLSQSAVLSGISEITQSLNALANTYSAGSRIKEGVKVCISGPPNCGKSSLLNAFLGYDRAIVSPEPGTTRDTVEDAFSVKGAKVQVTDTAGIRRHCVDAAEEEGMKRTLSAVKRSDFTIFLADGSRPFNDQDREVFNRIAEAAGEERLIIAVNKNDSPDFRKPQLPGGEKAFEISCKTGSGIENLKTRLASPVTDGIEENELIITSARHHQALSDALTEALAVQAHCTGEDAPLELCAVHLKAVLSALEELTGKPDTEELLERIFSKFCVGK